MTERGMRAAYVVWLNCILYPLFPSMWWTQDVPNKHFRFCVRVWLNCHYLMMMRLYTSTVSGSMGFHPCDTGQMGAEVWHMHTMLGSFHLSLQIHSLAISSIPIALQVWPIWIRSMTPVQPDFQLCWVNGDPKQETRGRRLRSGCLFFP